MTENIDREWDWNMIGFYCQDAFERWLSNLSRKEQIEELRKFMVNMQKLTEGQYIRFYEQFEEEIRLFQEVERIAPTTEEMMRWTEDSEIPEQLRDLPQAERPW